jgi:predicted ATPase
LEDKGDRYELTGPLPPLAIPSTLQDSLMARLDRFAPVKVVAQLAAVIGRETPYQMLIALSPLDERALQEALSQLVGSELMFRRGTIPDATYSFKHAFVQDAAYNSLLKSKRQQLHAKVAEALREQLPEVMESQPEILAQHLTEAGLTEQAISWWRRAGQIATERSANAEGTAHLHRALKLLRTLPDSPERIAQELDLLIALGSLVIISKGHGHPEVLTVYARARDLCRVMGDTSHLAPVLQGLRLYYVVTGDLASGQEAAQDLLALGKASGDSVHLVEGHRAVGVASFFSADFKAARYHLEQGFALYQSQAHGRHDLSYIEDDPGQTCLAYLARTLWVLGYPDQAVERGDQAIAVARATNHPPSIAEAAIWRAEIALFRGEVQDTRDRSAEVLALADEHGLPAWAGLANVMQGWAASELGQLAAGAAQIREGLSLFVKTGHLVFRIHSAPILACALAKAGQVEEALAVLDEVIESSDRAGVSYWASELHRRKGEMLLTRNDGEMQTAENCLLEALKTAQNQCAKSLELRAAMSLARLLANRGEAGQAYDLLAPIFGWFTEGFASRDLQETEKLLRGFDAKGVPRGRSRTPTK